MRAPTHVPADVAVVMVATNCRSDIERNLGELRVQEDVSLEVVIVDNGSTDGTRELLAEQPDLLLIANSENRWLSPARAQGVAVTSAPYILFFAPDTYLPPDAIAQLKACLDADERAGMAGPRLFDQDGRDLVNGQFQYPTARWMVLSALGLTRRFRSTPPPSHRPEVVAELEESGPQKVTFVNGSCMLVRRSALEAIGGVDERFLFGWEEVDLARDLYRAGYTVLLAPKVHVIHRGRGTPMRPGLREEVYKQSERVYFQKHHGAAAQALVRAARFAETGLRMIGERYRRVAARPAGEAR